MIIKVQPNCLEYDFFHPFVTQMIVKLMRIENNQNQENTSQKYNKKVDKRKNKNACLFFFCFANNICFETGYHVCECYLSSRTQNKLCDGRVHFPLRYNFLTKPVPMTFHLLHWPILRRRCFFRLFYFFQIAKICI